MTALGGVPCEGGCGRFAAGLGLRSYLCAPCTSKQAKRVRAGVMAAVAKRIQAERRIVQLTESYRRSLDDNPHGLRRVSRAELEAQYAR